MLNKTIVYWLLWTLTLSSLFGLIVYKTTNPYLMLSTDRPEPNKESDSKDPEAADPRTETDMFAGNDYQEDDADLIRFAFAKLITDQGLKTPKDGGRPYFDYMDNGQWRCSIELKNGVYFMATLNRPNSSGKCELVQQITRKKIPLVNNWEGLSANTRYLERIFVESLGTRYPFVEEIQIGFDEDYFYGYAITGDISMVARYTKDYQLASQNIYKNRHAQDWKWEEYTSTYD